MKNFMITMIVFAGVTFAQPPRGPGQPGQQQPRVDEVKAYLGLTDSQIQGLEQLRRTEMDSLQQSRQDIAQKQQALQQQIRNGSTDAAALGRMLLDIENLRKQITQKQGSFHDQAVAILTAAQKTKLKTLEDAQKLGPEIHEATALNLLVPQEGANGGPGPGPRLGGPGPQRFHPPASQE